MFYIEKWCQWKIHNDPDARPEQIIFTVLCLQSALLLYSPLLYNVKAISYKLRLSSSLKPPKIYHVIALRAILLE